MYRLESRARWIGWSRHRFVFRHHDMDVQCRFRTSTSGVLVQVRLPPIAGEERFGLISLQGPKSGRGTIAGLELFEIPALSAGSKRLWTNLAPEQRVRWTSRVYWEVSRLLHLPGTNQVFLEWDDRSWRSHARFAHCVPTQLKQWIDASVSTYESLCVSLKNELQFVSSSTRNRLALEALTNEICGLRPCAVFVVVESNLKR